MNFKKYLYITFLLLFISSCKINEENIGNLSSDTDSLEQFDVYQHGVTVDSSDGFNLAMNNNIIDQRMKEQMETLNLSSTYESQMFFDSYVEAWKTELSFSIDALKKYLNDDDISMLLSAQNDWEKSCKANIDFDRNMILNYDIRLGSQYISNALLYLIKLYRERVYHIKYMIYLREYHVSDAIAENDQLWNKWHEFASYNPEKP